jgi:WD40 repeat protein
MFLVNHSALAQTKEPTYWQDIRPILRKHCTVCHSAKNLREPDVSGGLALDTPEAVLKGSKHAILKAGKSSDSLIIHVLVTEDKKKRMPLDAKPLPAEEIALIKRWIDAGAREGQKPESTLDPVTAKKSTATRKLDVALTTSAVPPKGTFGKIAPAKLELAFKIGPLTPVTAVAFSPDNKLLVSGSYGQVVIWDLGKGQPVKVLTNVLGAVNDIRFSPDGLLLAVAGGQPAGKGDLKLYQVADWKLLGTLRGHEDTVASVAFRHDGKFLASASFDKTVRVWNVVTQQAEQTFTGHSDFVYAVAFSPDGKYLVSSSKDRTVKMVEAETGKSVFTFSGMDQDVLAVAYSPDGKQVVSSGFETSLYWWNPQTGEKIKTQGGHGIAVNELSFSKDGKRVVSAGMDRTARVWDGSAGTPIKTLAVGSPVYAVAISPSGKLIASGSFDGLVRVWDESGGRQLVTLLALPADNDQVEWLAQTPEGYATGSEKLTGLGRWRMAGQEVAGERVWSILRQPEQIGRALRGETVADVKFAK